MNYLNGLNSGSNQSMQAFLSTLGLLKFPNLCDLPSAGDAMTAVTSVCDLSTQVGLNMLSH